MTDEKFGTLFLTGVCLRDAEPALPAADEPSEGVSIMFTLDEGISDEDAGAEDARGSARDSGKPNYCVHCGAEAGAGSYCGNCGQPLSKA